MQFEVLKDALRGFNPASTPKTEFHELKDCHDLHCWVEHNGEIVDYDPEQLKAKSCIWGTSDLVAF